MPIMNMVIVVIVIQVVIENCWSISSYLLKLGVSILQPNGPVKRKASD
jgi:hypothetical protein